MITKKQCSQVLKFDVFTPKYLVVMAVIIGIVFLCADFMGWRVHTTFITGTTGNPLMSWRDSALLGTAYMVLYFCAVIVAPILVITAGLMVLGKKCGSTKDV